MSKQPPQGYQNDEYPFGEREQKTKKVVIQKDMVGDHFQIFYQTGLASTKIQGFKAAKNA